MTKNDTFEAFGAMSPQIDELEMKVIALDQANRIRGIGKLSAQTLKLLNILPPQEQLQFSENPDQLSFESQYE